LDSEAAPRMVSSSLVKDWIFSCISAAWRNCRGVKLVSECMGKDCVLVRQSQNINYNQRRKAQLRETELHELKG
jgi:hypothetical protein